MKKRGSYQKAKLRKNRIQNIFLVLVGIGVTGLFLWAIIESAVTVHNIDTGTYQTYSGAFTYRIVKGYGRHNHTIYRFTLDNGDELAVRAAFIDNSEELQRSDRLTFLYSTFPISLDAQYSVIAISSLDGATAFLESQDTRAVDIGQIWILSIILTFWLALCGVMIAIAILLRPKRKK